MKIEEGTPFRPSLVEGKVVLSKVDFWGELFGCAKELYDRDEAKLELDRGSALKKLLIGTYTILAAAMDSLTPTAMKSLLEVKAGKIKGVIHYLVAYGILYHWRKGRLQG